MPLNIAKSGEQDKEQSKEGLVNTDSGVVPWKQTRKKLV